MELPEALRECVVVVMTGAGASVPVGLPATREFRETCSESVCRRLENRGEDMVRFALQRLHAAGEQDIEEVLFRLENESSCAHTLEADPDFVSEVLDGDVEGLDAFTRRRDVLAEAIYEEVLATYGNVDPERAENLYRGLIGVYEQAHDVTGGSKTLLIFTLNYDTAIEHAAGWLDARLVDGFVPGTDGQRRWKASAFWEYEAQEDRTNVVLVKLHGSVRLGARRIGAGRGELVELAEGLDRNPSPYEHVVLYPTLGSKRVSEEPFRTCYRLLRQSLEHAHLLLAIGCSFRDRELNKVVRDCIDRNPKLRILAMNPELEVTTLADRIGCEPSMVAVEQRLFGPEEEDTLRSGQGQLINCLRRWTATATHAPGDVGTYQFGTTVPMAPAPLL